MNWNLSQRDEEPKRMSINLRRQLGCPAGTVGLQQSTKLFPLLTWPEIEFRDRTVAKFFRLHVKSILKQSDARINSSDVAC